MSNMETLAFDSPKIMLFCRGIAIWLVLYKLLFSKGFKIRMFRTGVNIVPGSHWTLEEKGARQVQCTGVDDKHQITVVICATASGIFLPFQITYQGKIRVKPLHACQDLYFQIIGMHVTFTPNHWSNEEKTLNTSTKLYCFLLKQSVKN